jgi:uncharacterized protein (DUF302 family)
MTAPDRASDLVELPSAHSFEATLQHLLDALPALGLTLFAQIDHAANAAAVGLAMPPTTVLLYGNPKGGTPVMMAVPATALDLPLRLLIRQDEAGRTQVSYHSIAATLQSSGVAANMADRMTAAQAWIAATIGP